MTTHPGATSPNALFQHSSPEFQRLVSLGRSDSKLVGATCHGIAVSNGRPCRRAIKPRMGPAHTLEDLFCFQHRNQAQAARAALDAAAQHASARADRRPPPVPEKERPLAQPQAPRLFRLFANAMRALASKLLKPSRPRKASPPRKAPPPPPPAPAPASAHARKRAPAAPPSTFFPRSMQAETRKAMLQVLAKPPSSGDAAGFIYIFTVHERGQKGLRNPGTVWVKVGRAVNVQRRMYQWSQQCRYVPQLLAHHACTHSHRVEHLVHMELRAHYDAQPRAVVACTGCQTEHREWFSIPARDLEVVVGIVAKWTAYCVAAYK